MSTTQSPEAKYPVPLGQVCIDPTQRLKKQVEKLESVQANEIAELKAEVRKFKKEMLWNFKWVKKNLTREEFDELYLEQRSDKERISRRRLVNHCRRMCAVSAGLLLIVFRDILIMLH